MLPSGFVSICLLAASTAFAQDSRGTIAGRVTDPQGAVIPGASVLITNIDTNTVSRSVSNAAGAFEANLLNPGRYTVEVEMAGFQKSVHSGLLLQVAGRTEVDVQLQVGQVSESVEVTAAAPLLDTLSASGGRVIDQKQIVELPFSNLNPFTLTALAPGMQWTGQPEFRRPSDNAGTSAFNTSGGVGQNEYTIDGAPVTGTNRRVGFVPPSDAVEEFKLETTSFDASYGHTSGATVNVMTKAGTNTYHGSLYDQHWQQRWNATPHFARLAFEDAVRQGKAKSTDQRQAPGRSNNFGATLGGPVRIPKLFNGSNKLFFFASYNGNYESKPDTDSPNRTVPKQAWRQGDFSDLLAVDATRFTIYDPRSARREGSRIVRTPFPGNRGVPVLNPVYRYYEPIYPNPNDVPGLVSAEGFNNYYNSASRDLYHFNSLIQRTDYNISDRHRVYGRWFWNRRLTQTRDWAFETRPGLMASGTQRFNKGAGGNYVWTINGSNMLDLGANFARFSEGNMNDLRTAVSPSQTGLPSYLDAKAGDLKVLPMMDFQNIEDLSTVYPIIGGKGTTGEIKLGMMTIRGNHSLKYGWNERRYWFGESDPRYPAGRFVFNSQFTQAADDTRTASNHGLEWAAFRMGLPSTIELDTNDSAYWSTRYRSLYIQDDWRVTSKLRLSMGLRYEREGGITERFNRALSGDFLYDARLPITDAAQAAYARAALTELPASRFSVLGGTSYLGTRNSTYTNGTYFFLPRFGAVYQLSSKTVLRAGTGWYADTFNSNNTRPSQFGYNQPTRTVVSNDNGLTFCCGLGAVSGLTASANPMADPFPVRSDGTRFDLPYGNRLAEMARVGQSDTFYPRTYRPALQQRWRIGIQREIVRDTVFEAAYNGALARIPVNQPINALPQNFWATGTVRNQAVDDDMNRNVANPFQLSNFAALEGSNPLLYSYMRSVALFTNTVIRKNALLRPFPQMGTLNGLRPGVSFGDSLGRNRYHDLQLSLDRRFSKGLQLAVMYTYATSDTKDFYYNEFDSAPSWHPNNLVRPHRFVWSGIYELPFGDGRKWLRTNPLKHLAGGWQLSWVYQFQSGPPTAWGNRFFYGDLGSLEALFDHQAAHEKDIHAWFNPATAYRGSGSIPQGFAGFEGRAANQPGQFHVRVFPDRLNVLREDGIRNWDVKLLRAFRFADRARLSVSADLLNATNHTNFREPVVDPTNRNFGFVTQQRGLSRVIQLNARIDF